MPRRSTQNAYLTMRVSKALKKSFTIKAEKHGRMTDVLRELMTAFVEDRVVIQPPVNPKESLYVN